MPSEATDVGAMRLGDVVRSNIWIIVATSVLGLLLGFGASTRMEPQSTATTPILLTPLDGNPFDPTSRGSQLVNLESEAQSVRSTDVAELAKSSLESDLSESQLLSSVSVDVPVNTQILEISYSSTDDDVARTHSQAFAEAYLQLSAAAGTGPHRRAVHAARCTDRAKPTLGWTYSPRELSACRTDSAQASVLRQEIDTLARQVNTLSARRADLAVTPLDPGQVVTPACRRVVRPADASAPAAARRPHLGAAGRTAHRAAAHPCGPSGYETHRTCSIAVSPCWEPSLGPTPSRTPRSRPSPRTTTTTGRSGSPSWRWSGGDHSPCW